VKVRYDNASSSPNLSDAIYATGGVALAQTFSFSDDSTGLATTNGTWTTVTGSYNVAVGTGAAFGCIQIRNPLGQGEYTSGGGFFLDNVIVDVTAIPEPATIGLFGLAGAVALILRRIKMNG
jgi:hypothetical protein